MYGTLKCTLQILHPFLFQNKHYNFRKCQQDEKSTRNLIRLKPNELQQSIMTLSRNKVLSHYA